eukprot:gene5233-5894_t
MISSSYYWCIALILGSAFTPQESVLREKFADHYKAEKRRTDWNSVPFERVTQLYSKASKKHVQIVGRRVDALGKDGSPNARLIIQSDNFGRVRIRSNLTNYHICLGRAGKPVAIPMEKARYKDTCVFEEIYADNHYTEFRSLLGNKKSRWGLGFTKRGMGRKGRKVRPNGKAGQFLERPLRLVINLQGSSKNSRSGIRGLQEHIARLLKVYEDKL